MALTVTYDALVDITSNSFATGDVLSVNTNDVNVYTINIQINNGINTPLDLTDITSTFIVTDTLTIIPTVVDAATGKLSIELNDLSEYTTQTKFPTTLKLVENTVERNLKGIIINTFQLP